MPEPVQEKRGYRRFAIMNPRHQGTPRQSTTPPLCESQVKETPC
jgi:hypothetical protein